jgi:hypothetical protein
MNTILAGAERSFMISTGGVVDNALQCNNVLSVLKNGVLYMGGTITDYYGKPLNISSLSYMPDEVRIANPSIVMSNTGQMWCDWSRFYNTYVDDDGVRQYTLYSLTDLVNEINSNLSNLSSGTTSDSSSSVAGWYIPDPAG